jgi:hypothetical protein
MNASEEGERRGPGTGTTTTRLPTIAYVVGGVLIGTYLLAVALQWFDVDERELEWSRRLVLISGLETLAFAAAGAVLGTVVQRQATKKVEERADANEADAEKGRALVAYAKRRASEARRPGGDEEGLAPGEEGAPSASAYDDLLAYAEEYEARRAR